MKKLLTISLCIAMVICSFLLISCGNTEGEITINGHSLKDFKIVIPEEADLITEYAAENLALLVKEKTDIDLAVIRDSEEEADCEILIGNTNRAISSKFEGELADGEYLLFAKGGKIVCQGSGVYVGGACGELVNTHIMSAMKPDGSAKVRSLSKTPEALKFVFPEKYTSVIFMIGDGMGFQHVKMFEKNKSMTFVGNMFPVSGKSVTRSLSVMNGEAGYTDSAASATAMATGFKTLNQRLGVDENGATLLNIRELAHQMGAKTAVITTDIVTGATPSAYLVHHNSRYDTEIIQAQIDALLTNNEIDYLAADVDNELTNKLAEALALISKDSDFFIMLEEAMIDKTSDDQDIWGTIRNVTRFNDAVAYASQFVMCHPNVALIVTADHETGKLTPYPALGPGFMFESYSHTNYDVPVYALGAGVSVLNGKKLENTELAQFAAKAFSNESFGTSYEPIN